MTFTRASRQGLKSRLISLLVAGLTVIPVLASDLRIGESTVRLAPRAGDATPPRALWLTADAAKRPVPTNQWYSSLVFSETPQTLYAQPLTYLPVTNGIQVALPTMAIEPTERKDVEIRFPHRHGVTIAPTAFAAGRARLARTGDWTIDISMAPRLPIESANGSVDDFRLTAGHGLPYAQFRVSRGDLELTLPAAAAEVPGHLDARTLLLKSRHQTFAFFGPHGVKWVRHDDIRWRAELPAGKRWLAVTVLPDNNPQTLALLERHASSFVTDSRAEWRVDLPAGRVHTSFEVQTEAMDGPDPGPLLGLYPHHWYGNSSVAPRLGPGFPSVRGQIRLLSAARFETQADYRGFVPWWPAIQGADSQRLLKEVMDSDLRNARRMMLPMGEGPYWQGKGLQRVAKMLDIFDAHGLPAERDRLQSLLKSRIEQWFSGRDRKTYFQLDSTLGTLVAHPQEYFSIDQMNDHHFHWGYWIRTVAELALRDPAWAGKDRWGGLVDLMVADIATTRRDDRRFPFLRTFDIYESHSWASGVGLGEWGNNQESSSEAINAWVGLILWGEIHGDRPLRDLGIWLYTSEISAIDHYWFDRHRLVFPPEYPHLETSMLFGGRYAHNTWWTDEPRQIKGINLLPITTASAYLGADPAYVKRNLATLPKDTEIFESRLKRAEPHDIWQDLFAKYLALADPDAALKAWNRWGAVELGDSRTHTLHWLLSLRDMGTPDASVHADTALYAVFRKSDGQRTYLAYNAAARPITVSFSDGARLEVGGRSMGRHSGVKP